MDVRCGIYIKKLLRICSFLSAVIVFTGCNSNQQLNYPGNVQFSSPPGVVKAMSFNIRVDTFLDGFNGWNSRRQLIFDIISDNAADVVGVQEALDHQVGQIQQALPQYSHYAAGRDDGMRKGESCAIFYRKDRFELADSGTFWFSDTPSRPGSKDWGSLWPRICSWVYLTDKQTGGGFYVYNLHLSVLSQKSRQKSMELLARRIAARKTAEPFIVMGDFNMKVDNPAMVYLQNLDSKTPYPRMITAWQSLYPGRKGESTTHTFRGMIKGPKIDHIPISEGAQALDIKIDRRHDSGRYASDHFPVIANIRLAGLHDEHKPITAKTNP